MKNTGFTLVELAIVLVIIGLLTGGILAAKSMIATAKITATISQMQQLDVATQNFKTKYNFLPGDVPNFHMGDGDGMITIIGYAQAVNSYETEISLFWNELDPSKYADYYCVPGNCLSPGVVLSGPGQNVPISRYSSEDFIMASAVALPPGNAPDRDNPRNYFAIIHQTSQRNAVTHCCHQLIPNYSIYSNPEAESAMYQADLLAIDKKMDDGLADSGNVVAGSLYDAGDFSGEVYDGPRPLCATGPTYLVANNSKECTPLFRIGGQTGDPR